MSGSKMSVSADDGACRSSTCVPGVIPTMAALLSLSVIRSVLTSAAMGFGCGSVAGS